MFVSIGLTVHDRLKLAEYCINSIHDQTSRGQYELIVVDNCSDFNTKNMLRRYYEKNYVGRLIYNNKNNLGSAINHQWHLADPSAEWLLTLDNDNLCMPGWLDNFKLVVDELKPDFLFTQIRMPLFHNQVPYYIENSGCCLESPVRKIPYGAGLAIRKQVVDKYKIRFPEGDEPWSIGGAQGSVYSVMGMILRDLKLSYVDLGKPCILAQDCEYANPEYFNYYSKVFGYSGRGGKGFYGIGGTKMSKFESLRIRGGNTRYPDQYYEGTDYEIGKHWRKALESKEGQALWDDPMYDAPKGFLWKINP